MRPIVKENIDHSVEEVIPVMAETLQVEKKRVQSGGVRVKKLVNSRKQVIDEPLLHEEVEIDRVVLQQEVEGPQPIRYEGDIMIIPIMEEVLVVEKKLVVKEELRIRRRITTVQQPREVTLRSEEAIIERIPSPPEQP